MFGSAKLKLHWANKHVRDFDARFRAFVDGKAYTLGAKENPETGSKMATIRYTGQLPSELGLMLGDAVHNLRAALDHAMWELIGRDRGTQDRYTTLPTGEDRISYEALCNGIKTPRGDTKKFLSSLGAYKDGPGKSLYALHRLDIADKHIIMIPVVRLCQPPTIQRIRPDGSVLWELGGAVFTGEDGGAVGWKNVPPEDIVQFNKDHEPTFDILFGDVEGFPSKPIIPTLMHLMDAVRDTLGQFENFVRVRPA